jgi:HD domain protein
MSEAKIINDPVFGFIKIPRGVLLNIVRHPLMQRLTRIKQLGLASAVYPGAQHTRFQHSIGAFHLVSEAVFSLQQKGIFIFDSEAEAVEAAILMHDIGHGPFSHVLENTLISGISHEEISLLMMEQMNREMNGALTLSISIFKNEYPKRFLHQLISSQLDMDRLDYLSRDSFFTGVSEGNIGSARIIKMLDVVDDGLVVDHKGIYSIESYLIARRLMYWQVYLHKTAVACEAMLINVLRRAKQLTRQGRRLFATPALTYFLENDVDQERFRQDAEALHHYCALDDNDIWSSVKVWMNDKDRVLALLSANLVERNIFRVKVYDEPIPEEKINAVRQEIQTRLNLSDDECRYLLSANTVRKNMYSMNDDHISIKYKDGTCKDISEASELFDIARISKKNSKYYLCFQRI